MHVLKTTILMGTGVLIKLVIGLIAVKLAALYLGLENFGITGQISSLMAVVTLIAGGGVSIGVAKIFSDPQTEQASQIKWLKSACQIVFGAGLLLVFLLLIIKPWLTNELFSNYKYSTLIIVIVILSIFPIGISNIGQGILNGKKRADLYAWSLIIGGVLGLLGVVVSSELFGAVGVIFGLVWIPVAQALSIWMLARPLVSNWKILNLNSGFDNTNISYLFKYGSLSIAAGLTIPLVHIAIRLLIQNHSGGDQLGLWQATVRISEAYTQLPLLMLSVFFFPKFAEKARNRILLQDLIYAYGFMLVLCAVICITIYLFRELIIGIVFTKQFYGVSNLLPMQLLGDILRILAYLGTTILAARGMVKVCLIGELMQAILYASLGVFLIPHGGISGAFSAYVFTYVLYLLFTVCALIAFRNRGV